MYGVLWGGGFQGWSAVTAPQQQYAALAGDFRATDAYGGRGFFAGFVPGVVTVAGEPARRRIFAFERYTMKLVRDCWSNADGTYLLPMLKTGEDYLLLATDKPDGFAPVGYDFVKPAVDDA